MQALASWPCPGTAGEMAVVFDDARAHRLLIVPALLDEAPRMRRFTLEVMRRLDGAGIDCFLPDLPGCNESLAPLEAQSPGGWRLAMIAAAAHFAASHVLTIRGGAMVAPTHLPGWRYAPTTGADQMRHLLRARILASREAGREERREALLALGHAQGLELAGMRLGPGFVGEFIGLTPDPEAPLKDIAQDMLGIGEGGGGLWLRAEPGEDAAQADALAAVVAIGVKDAGEP